MAFCGSSQTKALGADLSSEHARNSLRFSNVSEALAVRQHGEEKNSEEREASFLRVPTLTRIPIVVLTGDPVKQGIAESLAHPGGNFTGVSVDAGLSIYGKRIALLREMIPTMSKLGCLILRLQWDGGPIAGSFKTPL